MTDYMELSSNNILVQTNKDEITQIIEWLYQIKDPLKREQVLLELSKKRESFADLAIYLWYSSGTVVCLYFSFFNL